MTYLGEQLDDGVLESGAQELPSELIGHPELFKTLDVINDEY